MTCQGLLELGLDSFLTFEVIVFGFELVSDFDLEVDFSAVDDLEPEVDGGVDLLFSVLGAGVGAFSSFSPKTLEKNPFFSSAACTSHTCARPKTAIAASAKAFRSW